MTILLIVTTHTHTVSGGPSTPADPAVAGGAPITKGRPKGAAMGYPKKKGERELRGRPKGVS